MHDPKFEQEVQRKMHDLEFIPSEAVWENIRQNMAPRPRRRMVAAFWWWLAPGLLALGAGGMFYGHSRPGSEVAGKAGSAAHGSATVATTPPGKSGSSGLAGVVGNAGGTGIVGNAGGTGIAGNAGGNGIAGNAGSAGARARVFGVMGDAGNGNGARMAGVRSGAWGMGVKRTQEDKNPLVVENGRGVDYHAGLIGGVASRSDVGAPHLYPRPVNTAVSGIRRPQHPWRVGFAAGGGASSVNGQSSAGTVYSSYVSSYSIGSPQTLVPSTMSVASTVSKRLFSEVKPDLSYWAGVFGEKQLSRRWSVDLGLNLHYYSARLVTNEQVNNYAPSSASLFQATTVTYALNSANTYSTETVQTYLDKYYFLEVPATAQWRINRNRMFPLFWRGGAIFSYLMGSDAMYYDSHSGSFYKGDGFAHHAQGSLQTGLSVGIPLKGMEIQAGPEVQYAVSSMLRNGSTGGHLVFGGMRVAVTR